ncbi:hypothetical protein Dimus_003876, partial [Dionaea muscipula]
MRSCRLGDLCDLDPEIERTLHSIRVKRRSEINTQNQKEMDDPPPSNHVPVANGAANQRPLREYAAPQVNALLPGQLASVTNNRNQGNLPSKTEVNPRDHVNAITLRSGRELGETSEQKGNKEIEKDVEHEQEEQAEIDEGKNESNGKGKVEVQFVE